MRAPPCLRPTSDESQAALAPPFLGLAGLDREDSTGPLLMRRGRIYKPIGADCREKFDNRDWCSLEPVPVDALRRGGNLICVEIPDQRIVAGNLWINGRVVGSGVQSTAPFKS